MAQAVIARQHGDDYQARLFWLHASKLLDPDSWFARVVFEAGPKGFDDVVVHYERHKPAQDAFGRPVFVDFYQCKWHVSPAGSIGYVELTILLDVFGRYQTLSVVLS